MLTAVASQNGDGVGYVSVTVNDGSTSFTQRIGIAVTGAAAGIYSLDSESASNDNAPCYNLAGQRIGKACRHTIFIQNGKKVVSQ